jgi:hypothetical protein
MVLLIQGLFGLAVFTASSNNIGFVTSSIETNLALITASAPALRPIFRSRERGGWFSRTSVATSRATPADVDVETGQKSVGWGSTLVVGSGVGGKFGRGGSRGGRKGGNRSMRNALRSGGSRGGSKIKPIIRIKTDVAELRSQSPRTSEEEAMTNDGIMRVSDIQREIDGIVKEIAVSGVGTYTGDSRPRTPRTPKTPSARPRPSLETITIGATMITPPRPSTSSGTTRSPERHYSESIYPDQGIRWRDDRDSKIEDGRISRYGDRRFGVVTPKGTTPTSKGWEGSGRPF